VRSGTGLEGTGTEWRAVGGGCRPDSVSPKGGVHSSGPRVTTRLERPTRGPIPMDREAGADDPRPPYSALLHMGFTVPCPSPVRRCALTAPFHPCSRPTRKRFSFCGTFPRVAAAGCCPACCPPGVRTFLRQERRTPASSDRTPNIRRHDPAVTARDIRTPSIGALREASRYHSATVARSRPCSSK